jgi:hypothetical protein
MTKYFRNSLLAILWAFVCFSSSIGRAAPQPQKETVVDALVPAIVQAVEDEIYDLHEEGKYFLVDDQGAGNTTPATIAIYVSKEISANGNGVAVYKLMPYGEVYRYFVVRSDGLVVLSDDPHHGFLPTGGSMLTVYMSDEVVCDFIAHRSIKSSFVVDPDVSKQRLGEAIQRQLKRTGFSYRRYLSEHARRK